MMPFGGHIIYLWPEECHLRPSGKRVQMMPRGTQINYMPDKSDYHYYQYTRPNRTNSFNKKKTFNRDVTRNCDMESCYFNTIS